MIPKLDQRTRVRAKAILAAFAGGIALGAAAVFVYPGLMESILAGFQERFGADPALDASLAWQIFRQNLTVSAIAWLGGFVFGVLPMFITLANGFILGYICLYMAKNAELWSGNAAAAMAVGLLPHGIIELPAFLWAAALGLRLGLDWLDRESSGRRWQVLWITFRETLGSFAWVILMLAVAACIEVFVSGNLVNNL